MSIRLLIVSTALFLAACGGTNPKPVDTPPLDTVDVDSLPVNDAEPVQGSKLYYPKNAAKDCLDGFVKLRFIVDTDGKAQEIQVLESEPGDAFVNSAARMLFEMEFEPLLDRDARPILSQKTMRLEFPKLKGCGKPTS